MPAQVNKDLPLQGVGVLITRPREQAAALCDLIAHAGGQALVFPALEIADVVDTAALYALIARLHEFDIAIFISPNAVHKALNLIRARREWPTHLKVAAVGRGSARELSKAGIPVDIVPTQRYDSEALLELPALHEVSGRRIVILRGEGGREMLAQTLIARGAAVEYAECYRRLPPTGDVGDLLRRWARGDIDAVVVTSNEALRNLFDVVGQVGRQWLRATQLIVVSERQAQLAQELGFTKPAVVGARADDAAMFAALCAWKGARGA